MTFGIISLVLYKSFSILICHHEQSPHTIQETLAEGSGIYQPDPGRLNSKCIKSSYDFLKDGYVDREW